eukprot:TRINITY_DN27_c0_g1_i17.p11 TRINITY_DN27_c0_g1~~TRINITY_DN27_c0_g1_i17.p11  ORF type:complete len:147 (+),score=12.55 TRINITY_DN27_c0_g1_i17:3593-4033(+)
MLTKEKPLQKGEGTPTYGDQLEELQPEIMLPQSIAPGCQRRLKQNCLMGPGYECLLRSAAVPHCQLFGPANWPLGLHAAHKKRAVTSNPVVDQHKVVTQGWLVAATRFCVQTLIQIHKKASIQQALHTNLEVPHIQFFSTECRIQQ